MRRYLVIGALTAALGAAAAITAGTAYAGAPSNGCPPGFDSFAVADLLAQGYGVPAVVDSAAWFPGSGFEHADGNNDGYICGQPLGNQTTPSGLQLYWWFDNNLTPGH
jgi:hypothetical protein